MKNDTPKASVLIITYNHEQFIEEALNSVLLQECDFNYEIVVADDCSTDNTEAILNGYVQKHPHLIRLLPAQFNYGITKNYQRAFKECRGEYIAILEGDDYWTSPYKLTRQINFLHEHRECVMCFNRFYFYYENSGRFTLHPAFGVNDQYELLTADKLIKDNFIGNFSACVYRKSVIDALDDSLYTMKVYDWMFNIVVSQYGMIGYLPEVMSAYRKHTASTFAGKSVEEQENEMLTLIEIYNDYLAKKFDDEFMHMKQRIMDIIEHRTKLALFIGPQSPVLEEEKEYPAGTIRALVGTMCSLLIPKIVVVVFELILPPVVLKATKYLWKK